MGLKTCLTASLLDYESESEWFKGKFKVYHLPPFFFQEGNRL